MPIDPINDPTNARYGAASRYDFDNPSKWHTVQSVPLLDEHELTGDDGRPVAQVDRSVLEEIARNNNHKVRSTGDPATLILGHTSDDPRAPEKPAQGFVVNYHVKPFKRGEDGRVIYAIHGDYKVRPEKAHLIEDYPRRSVELWWHKKDIDPIAMLGGSSPERDLGVVLRHSRFNHISLDTTPKTGTRNGKPSKDNPTEVIRFHRRGNFVIESYSIEQPRPTMRYAMPPNGKMGKVMHEFKHGELHSGSKSGPKVTSRQQALAIGESEARKHPTKKSTAEGNMGMKPNRYEDDDDDKMCYGDDDLGMDSHDPGDEGVPPEDDGMGMGDDSDDQDPTVQKVMQSKWAKGIDSKLTMILEALQGAGAGGGGDMGAEPPPGGPDGMGGEMPPPGAGAAPPMGAGVGAPPPGDDANQDGVPDEEESRRGMGQRPVQMGAGASTGFPGPSDGYIPSMNGKRKMSRSIPSNHRGTTSMNGSATRQRSQVADPRDAIIEKLKYDRDEMMRDNAYLEAQNIVEELEHKEGILFCNNGDPERYARNKSAVVDEIATAIIHDKNTKYAAKKGVGVPDSYVADKIDEIRYRYARRQTDNQNRRRLPQSTGVARYARNPVQEAGATADTGAGDDFEPQTDEQVMELVELQTTKKMPQAEALKYMRKKYGGR